MRGDKMKNIFNFLNPLKKIPQMYFYQMNPSFFIKQRNNHCCFGAHLAKILNQPLHRECSSGQEPHYLYTDGKIEFLKRTGMSEDECNYVFCILDIVDPEEYTFNLIPFGSKSWNCTVKEAIARLEKYGEGILKDIRKEKK